MKRILRFFLAFIELISGGGSFEPPPPILRQLHLPEGSDDDSKHLYRAGSLRAAGAQTRLSDGNRTKR